MSWIDRLLGSESPTLFTRLGLAPHQIEGANRALYTLQRRGGVILADHPGLGKSFIALAVIAAQTAQGDRALIVCPSGLLEQWAELLARFEIRAQLCSQDSLTTLAMDAFGLVVVDEAHHFRNRAILRFHNLARATLGARIVLITATPFCNSWRDIETLVSWIVADDSLHDRGVDSIGLAFEMNDAVLIDTILDELMIRRTREVLSPEFQAGVLRRRVIWHSSGEDYDGAEGSISHLRFPGMERHAPILRRHLHRRLESSQAAFRQSLQRQKRFYIRLQSMRGRGLTLTKHDWLRSFASDGEESEQEPLFPEAFASEQGSFEADGDSVAAELVRLDRVLGGLAADHKRLALEQVLDGEPEAATIIFTASVATAIDLHRLLRERWSVALLTSRYAAIGTRRASRATILASFRSGALKLVVSTDLASEGLNLERGSRVIHYDLPWTNSRIEQRNGRVWRIGQSRGEIEAVYFLPSSHRSTGILSTLARKSRQSRRIFEGSALYFQSRGRNGEVAGSAAVLWKPGPERVALVVARLLPRGTCQLLLFTGGRLIWSWKTFHALSSIFVEGDWCTIHSEPLEEICGRYAESLRSAQLLPPLIRNRSEPFWPRPLRIGADQWLRSLSADQRKAFTDREAEVCCGGIVSEVTIESARLIGEGW